MATYEAQQRRAAIDAQRIKDWETERMAIVRAERQEAPTTTQPIIIHTGWQPTRPPAPVDDRPGFGAGAVTTLLIIAGFALLWHLISTAGGQSAAFFLGALVVIIGAFFSLLIFSWARAQ